MGMQARHGAGAAHAVPLVAQPAGVEVQRMASVLRRSAVLHGDDEARAPVGVGNTPSSYSRGVPAAAPARAAIAAGRCSPAARSERPVMSRSRPRVVARCSLKIASAFA
jgi:hypothetical protein